MSNFKQLNEGLDIRAVVSKFSDITENNMTVCPFHNDNNPSMLLNKDNTLHCFTCKTHCDIIAYYAKQSSLDMVTAAKELAQEYELQFFAEVDNTLIKRRQEVDKALEFRNKDHESYLLSRGIERSGMEEFNIGGIGEWIVQPIYDDNDKLAFINKRSITNPKGHFIEKGAPKDKVVGGLNIAKGMRGPVIITEGYFDVIQAWQEGLACVNVFGSVLSETQALKILKYFDDVTLAFDNDDAGLEGALKAFRLIKKISPTSKIDFAKFEGKDIGEWLYRNSSVERVSYYDWAKLNNRPYKETIYTIKNSMSPLEKRLNCLRLAEDYGVTINDIYEELEVV